MAVDAALGDPLRTATKYAVGRASDAAGRVSNWNDRLREAWVNHARLSEADPLLAREGYDASGRVVTTGAALTPWGRAARYAVAGARMGELAIARVANEAMGANTLGDMARNRVGDAARPHVERLVDRLTPSARAAMER